MSKELNDSSDVERQEKEYICIYMINQEIANEVQEKMNRKDSRKMVVDCIR